MDTTISQSLLRASGVVGSWVHDTRTGWMILSGSFPTLLGLERNEHDLGLSLGAFLGRIHPDDRARVESYFHTIAATGGPVEAEFRTCESPAGIRTLVMRGRMKAHDEQGCGIAIDRTEEHADDVGSDERIVNRMAEHVIALRGLAHTLRQPDLMGRVDGLMVGIGFELARYVPRPDSESESDTDTETTVQ